VLAIHTINLLSSIHTHVVKLNSHHQIIKLYSHHQVAKFNSHCQVVKLNSHCQVVKLNSHYQIAKLNSQYQFVTYRISEDAKNKGLAVSTGGNLPCLYIFHMVSRNDAKAWKNTIENCLVEADNMHLTSIVFPLLGTGKAISLLVV